MFHEGLLGNCGDTAMCRWDWFVKSVFFEMETAKNTNPLQQDSNLT